MCLFNCRSRTVFSPDFYSLAGDRPKQGNSTQAATIPDTPTQDNPTQANERTESQSNPHGESDKRSAAEEKSGNGARVSGHKVQGKYSIKFKIIDQTGKICNGMYYSVKVIGTKELYNSGTTDANGETEVFYSDIADKAYLYIGHRIEKFEDLPTSRSTPEQISDECNLNNGGDQQITMTPHEQDKPPVTVQTQRLWKPWILSQQGRQQTAGAETMVLNPYDNDGSDLGNVTIGIGHLIHGGPFVMNQRRVDSIVNYLKTNQIPVNVSNIVNNLEKATNLSGLQLQNAKAEMKYVNGLTQQQGEELFNKDVIEHQSNIAPNVHVPLHQYEYDTLSDLCFNSGPYRLRPKNSRIGTKLNEGLYTLAGQMIATREATEENRRIIQESSWKGKYQINKMKIIDHNITDQQPPWKNVGFTK